MPLTLLQPANSINLLIKLGFNAIRNGSYSLGATIGGAAGGAAGGAIGSVVAPGADTVAGAGAGTPLALLLDLPLLVVLSMVFWMSL